MHLVVDTLSENPYYLTSVQTLIVAFIAFVIGFIAGHFAARRVELTQNVTLLIAVFITGIWAFSIVSGIIVPDYSTSIFIHVIMGSVVGYLFGVENPLS